MAAKTVIAASVCVIGALIIMNTKTVTEAVSKWSLSTRSQARMVGIHRDLKAVVKRAIELSPLILGSPVAFAPRSSKTRSLKRSESVRRVFKD